MKARMYAPLSAFLLTAAGAPAIGQTLTDQQREAMRSACRSDYQKVCASVPTGGQQALECLQQHRSQLSSGCQSSLPPAASSTAGPAAPSTGASTTGKSATAAAPIAAAPEPGRQLAPREKVRALRSQCGDDLHKFCSEVRLGGGRAENCLQTHATELSATCRTALQSVAPAGH